MSHKPTDLPDISIMETPASAKICTNCGKEAKKHCAGCVGGIDANGVVVQKERYCSETCQLSAWKNHRYICKQLATRKQLYRAGQIVQDAFLAYREKTFDLRITRVEKKENEIHLYEGAYGDKEPLVPFPADLVDNAEDKKMVLTWSTCSEAVGRMSKLLKDLLRGITYLNLMRAQDNFADILQISPKRSSALFFSQTISDARLSSLRMAHTRLFHRKSSIASIESTSSMELGCLSWTSHNPNSVTTRSLSLLG